MNLRRGDTVLIRFPFADVETYKRRPALVLQDEAVETGFEQRLVAKITSNMDRTGESRVRVDMDSPTGQAMGILTDSMIVADHIATVEPREIDSLLGHCPDMTAVDEALRIIMGLSVRPPE
jgi:mRNA-degrading endonuclease toxin of MazEF toxin-antitoxin module